MPVEILTKEDLESVLSTFKFTLLKEVKNLLTDKVKDEWISGQEARELLECSATKSSQLVSDKKILKKGEGKGSRYSKKSIIAFLEKGSV